ncbi:MAG: UDP-N-acetylmuramoyl-L-alanine--D-glutamate ligase, partial [Muribaculaceae bacterium]|nr:UDP-N-acetylmuramoyl-L-alanine--D-glutamate ligase [Muribaculaceae bacterium]
YIDAENNLIFNTPGTSLSMPRADLALNGLHNVFNSMAAGLSACLFDIRKDTIRQALSDFNGVEHRLEFVRDRNGVRWINDSKATNVNSCWYALEAMNRPTVLILGGKDKGNDYSEILPLVRSKVKAIVAMGKDNAKIVDFFKDIVPVTDTHSLADAVEACNSLAVEGDTVLLSPCCASFDLFSSYEDRGRQFKDAVKSL